MILTTIYRIFFSWEEYETMRKFESENEKYIKVGEDTRGTTYEYQINCMVTIDGRKE